MQDDLPADEPRVVPEFIPKHPLGQSFGNNDLIEAIQRRGRITGREWIVEHLQERGIHLDHIVFDMALADRHQDIRFDDARGAGDLGKRLRERRREILALPGRALNFTRSADLAGHHAEEAVILAEVPIRGQHAVHANAKNCADCDGDRQAHDVDAGHHLVAHQVA